MWHHDIGGLVTHQGRGLKDRFSLETCKPPFSANSQQKSTYRSGNCQKDLIYTRPWLPDVTHRHTRSRYAPRRRFEGSNFLRNHIKLYQLLAKMRKNSRGKKDWRVSMNGNLNDMQNAILRKFTTQEVHIQNHKSPERSHMRAIAARMRLSL